MKIKNYLNNNQIVKRILNGIVMGVGGAVVSKVLLTIFNILLARILTVEAYGAYSLINNTVQTFTVFAGAGIGVTLTRYIALYREKDIKQTGILLGTLMVINIIISLIISIFVFIFADKIAVLLKSEIEINNLLRITAGTIFFTAVVAILQGALQGFESYKNIATIQVIANFLNILLGVILARYFGIVGAIYSLLILQVFMFIMMVNNLAKNIKKNDIKLNIIFNKEVKQAILQVTIPSFLATVFVLPIMWITNFYFSSNIGLEEFAAFSVCLQWFNIVNYIPQQLGQLKPIYTQLYDEKKYSELKKYNNKIISITIIFSICCSLFLFIIRNFILKSYGDYYTSCNETFIIMLITTVIFAIQSQYGSVFQAIGKSWLCFTLNVIWALSYLISFFVLYKIGIVGYAYTYLISYSIYAITSTIAFYIIMKKGICYDKENNYKNLCEHD